MSETVNTGVVTKDTPKKKKNPKQRRKIIGGVIAAAVVAALVLGLVKFLGGGEAEAEVLTDMVSYGSITSTVEGSGVAKAQQSTAITITTAGTVMDVFVTEGQRVEMGTPLFTIDSPTAQTALERARQELTARENTLSQLMEAANNLTVRAEYSGKLLEVNAVEDGANVMNGQVLAKLVDDGTMLLEQYYSYAYEHDIRVGQSATVSIPVVMEQLPGRVVEVNKVNRISPEGSRLFQAVIAVENPGVLTEGMAASAFITAGGESIYPYEQSALKYNRTSDVVIKVNGTASFCDVMDYMDVSAGQVLMEISGAENEAEIFTAQEALAAAQTAVAEAEQNIANLSAVAPISGTVMGLTIMPGQEIEANTAVISIADTTVIEVVAQVDERNISYIKAGMYVDIDQWGTLYSGFVKSVSLTPEYNGNAAMYPAVIMVDNPDGMMVTGGSVTYSLVASESDGCLVLPIQCVKYVPNEETGESMSVVFLQTDVRPDNAIDIADTTTIGVPAEGYYAVPVETGISDKNYVEILSGLSEGDMVFTNIMRQNSWY